MQREKPRALRSRLPAQTGDPEVEPGCEVQVDFGKGAPVERPGRKRRRPHVLRVVLSCSRKAYSEAIWRQTTDAFLGTLENSFWYFGGIPKTVVIDNLKAAVTKADWFDPELNPKLEVFARHYGCVILPTKPYTPRHKGKVESSVDYVQSNGLKGRSFETLEDENNHLLDWEANVADKRIHGTTRRQVGKVFEDVERRALLPLPAERFPFFHEGERSVHRDGHVEVDKAYYSVPPEYLGRRAWVRWDTRLVRILNQRFDEIAVHAKKRPGVFSTSPAHVPPEKISGVERGATHLLKRATLVGPDAGRWAEAVIRSRGIPGMRTAQGILSLARRHTSAKVDLLSFTSDPVPAARRGAPAHARGHLEADLARLRRPHPHEEPDTRPLRLRRLRRSLRRGAAAGVERQER